MVLQAICRCGVLRCERRSIVKSGGYVNVEIIAGTGNIEQLPDQY